MARLPDSHPRNRDRDSRERDKEQRRGGRGATPSRRPGSSRQIPGWMWLVAGIGGGMLITSLIKMSSAPDSADVAEPAAVSTAPKAVPEKVAPKVATVVVKKPAETAVETQTEKGDDAEVEQATQFDFYTLLPEREVIVPEREAPAPAKPVAVAPAAQSATAATPATTTTAPAAAGTESYLLQAGSFRGNTDAERRRAQISALGLQARIETVRAGSDTWYRVHAGPFNTRDQLATARSRLSAQGIETLQIRQK